MHPVEVGRFKAYLRDLPRAELHLLDTGHLALEDKVDEIASLMSVFLRKVHQGSSGSQ